MGKKNEKKPSKIIPLQEPETAVSYTARVISVSDRDCVVDLSGTPCPARIAFSCLVRPLENDLVLCTLASSGDYYVTAVAEREGAQSAIVSFPGDVSVQSPAGSMNFLSAESVTVSARQSFNCVSDEALHKSNSAVVNYDRLTASGSELQSSFATIRSFSEMIHTMSKQVLQKFKNYIRHSEANDQVRAGNMSRQVKGLYSMDSEHTILVSKKDTKIDGERIHMG